MSGDYSRQRFDPQQDYSGVLMQQGRVQLDADWNEYVEVMDRRWRAETVDLVGRCGVPQSTPHGFRIDVDKNGQLTIGRGRIYVDGLLAENHGAGKPEQQELDPVLGEPRGDQPAMPLAAQPYVWKPVLPDKAGRYLVYLDVWTREVTFLQAPDLVESAVGVDTTTRLQTVWQVKVLAHDLGKSLSCGAPDGKLAGWPEVIEASAARLSTSIIDDPQDKGPCLLPPAVGYRGLENRLYRVQIHGKGPAKKATFVWSRDNGSVVASVTGIPKPDTLSVDQTGRDDSLRFKNGDWIEITDDARALAGQAGVMRKIIDVNPASRTIKLQMPLTAPDGFAADPAEIKARHTLVRRWDQSGAEADTHKGVLPVPGDGKPVTLEDGIQVTFGTASKDGEFHIGDYWVFAARTSDASVEPLQNAPPRGIHHHFGRLALADFDGAKWNIASDCRVVFPPLTALTTFSYVSGDGQEVAPDPSQPALFLSLPQPLQVGVAQVGVPGGAGPVVGQRVRFTVTLGGGRLPGGGNTTSIPTDADGVASCPWELDSTTPSQQVEAVLLGSEGQPVGLPVRFNASLSMAARVAYQPKNCPTLADVTNVQDAIDRLCQASHGSGCCVTVGKGGDFAKLDDAIQQLLERGQTDLCLCLLPGDHEMNGFVVRLPTSAPAVNLRVAGCGRGTRLKIVERAWTLSGLNSFSLSDLDVSADGIANPLHVRSCAEVLISGCQIGQVAAAGSLLTLTGATRVQVRGNRLTARVSFVSRLPPQIFRRMPEFASVALLAEESTAQPEMTQTSLDLSNIAAEQRNALADRIRRNVVALKRQAPDEDLSGYDEFAAALTAETPDAKLLATRLRDIFLRTKPGVALVLADIVESGLVENNTIVGAVSLCGEPGEKDLSVNELKQLGVVLVELPRLAPDLFSKAQGQLRLVGNRVTRLTLGSTMVETLAGLPGLSERGQAAEPLVGISKLLFLSDNVIEGNGNQILSTQLSIQANSFGHVGPAGQDGAVAGWALSLTALYQGNQAPLATELATILRNVSTRSFPQPKSSANFLLEIQDFGH